jgi:soluble lytic murein transglycosylase-like protein
MNLTLLTKWLKSLFLLSLVLAALGSEPALNFINQAPDCANENPKLILDTRAQVLLMQKKKILHSLDQVAYWLNPAEKWQLVQHIYRESQEQVVDPQLIVALIKTESGFKKEALSSAGARGLMQVMLTTAHEIANEMGIEWAGESKSLHEPQLNIRIGTYYLVKMLHRFENLELALTAYNIGPTALGRLMISRLNIPRKYSHQIIKDYRMLRQAPSQTM